MILTPIAVDDLAAQNAALDRGKLASSVVPSRRDSAAPMAVAQAGEVTSDTAVRVQNADSAGDGGSVPFVVALPAPPNRPAPRLLRTVPDVHGLVLRDAVRSLHNAGFRVQLTRSPATLSATTAPAAGELARTGTVVRLLYDY